MALGLTRGVVRLAEYDATWADEFRDEQDRLSVALADTRCEIEHIGSTAVRGMRAKPILDIVLAMVGLALKLRDLLRSDSRARERYASAEDLLALQFANDRNAYTAGKTAIVQRLLDGSY